MVPNMVPDTVPDTSEVKPDTVPYSADGNHRSAAAAHLGRGNFLNVLFPTDRMGLAPYNRLVSTVSDHSVSDFIAALDTDVTVTRGPDIPAVEHHCIGLYMGRHNGWLTLVPKAHTYDSDNAVQVMDADSVQRRIFDTLLGITNARDEQLNFVGGDRPVPYLVDRVDAGEFAFAVSLAPVSMKEIIDICEQDRFMPPQSTWFEPKSASVSSSDSSSKTRWLVPIARRRWDPDGHPYPRPNS